VSKSVAASYPKRRRARLSLGSISNSKRKPAGRPSLCPPSPHGKHCWQLPQASKKHACQHSTRRPCCILLQLTLSISPLQSWWNKQQTQCTTKFIHTYSALFAPKFSWIQVRCFPQNRLAWFWNFLKIQNMLPLSSSYQDTHIKHLILSLDKRITHLREDPHPWTKIELYFAMDL